MLRKVGLTLVAAATLVLAGCEPPLEPADAPKTEASGPELPKGFSNDLTDDVSGYYMPTLEVTQGKWRLDHVFLGQISDFKAWEAGTREGKFAPVMLEFVDETSPMTRTEMGEVRSGRVRVLPSYYSLEKGLLRFVGEAEGVGVVQLDAQLNDDALATARRNLGHEGAVLNGTLSINDGPPQAVGFRWWAGD